MCMGEGGIKILAMTVKMGNLYSRTLTVMFLPFFCISEPRKSFGHVCGNCPCAIFVFR